MINNLDGQPLFLRLKKYIPIVVAAFVAAGFMSAVVFFSRSETVAIVSHSMASLAGFSGAGWRSKLSEIFLVDIQEIVITNELKK
jgi:hypothetical protein